MSPAIILVRSGMRGDVPLASWCAVRVVSPALMKALPSGVSERERPSFSLARPSPSLVTTP